ncbi:hypothetical protein CTAYLR_009552 [Chrysophaeum taylorii]|uniref:pyridoxal 5'-phosphate synthase n=1 Tax=Chrysophaeum taylorii TaxID=2483200 RepID=A0AAD7UHY7_9STRA|nr:hypothetical protein CTAYLR_009552 [Chrysophaeum taylorii]
MLSRREAELCAVGCVCGAVITALAPRVRHLFSRRVALKRRELPSSPHELFQRWLREAEARDGVRARALVLATSAPDDGATARYVLPHSFGDPIILGTNIRSQKARQLLVDGRCELVWRDGDRQVRIRGTAIVAGAADARSLQTFANLAPPRRWGVELLDQGRPIDDEAHDALLRRYETEFNPNNLTACPDNFTAVAVTPATIEFFQGGHPAYINDRFLYVRDQADPTTFNLLARLQA